VAGRAGRAPGALVEGALGLHASFGLRRGESFRLDLTLSIPPGSTVALLGPNGAGKSTAVAAIAGLLAIESGAIRLAGNPLDEPANDLFIPPEDRRIGVVFQDYLLFPRLTVIENVAFGLRSRGVSRTEAMQRAKNWLDRLELTGLDRRKPPQLSGGQAQRVALARALVIEPDLLLLDEPLSALDVTTRVELRRVLARHLEEFPGPRLVITHDPTEAFLLADQVHIIENGAVTQAGSPDEIRLRPRTPYAADLAGSNLLIGHASDGKVEVGSHLIHLAEQVIEGEVLLTIRPSAISLHRDPPEGSPRNTWQTSIVVMERLGERTRVRTGGPIPLTVEVTSEAAMALELAEGERVWLAIKATEIGVETGGVSTRSG
ncbi:MAG TPA: ATP-binding cassette domain-containing protein, partial [Acidimicrobiia bacterium]|nr:ATP-binding cassette domain-containing protein [Acidimicrobiia bacterium]